MRACKNPPNTTGCCIAAPASNRIARRKRCVRRSNKNPSLVQSNPPPPDNGYVVVALNEQKLNYRELIFARQLIRLHHSIATLPERDRLTPILDAIAVMPGTFGALWLEVPDTNDGKLLSTFTRRFQPLLETALREQGRLSDNPHTARLHIFFPDKTSVLIGSSDPHNSADAVMGIVRQSMPAEAPSRSTMKLAEAIEVFMDRSEQTRLLRQGMTGGGPGCCTRRLDLATGQARHPRHRGGQRPDEGRADKSSAGATSQAGRLQICAAQSGGLAGVRHGGKTLQGRRADSRMVRGRLVQTRDLQPETADEAARRRARQRTGRHPQTAGRGRHQLPHDGETALSRPRGSDGVLDQNQEVNKFRRDQYG